MFQKEADWGLWTLGIALVGPLSAFVEKKIKSIFSPSRIAGEIKQIFEIPNFSNLGQLLDENWHFQKELHPSVNTARIDELVDIAKKSGCSGGKACGAGGGGCLVFHCNPDRMDSARRAFREVGVNVIPFRFDFEGPRTWSPE